ncbi:UV DNA damage repair endonuclease UvsE [Adhaeribacter rhizoryzae]|uniref:UV DNA damage repair endonuclease UvsE n=1 Tax=Adhaeribacter rhizoryzae TaxID=2607907 RepID=A0A5M6DLK8_9BACT|nr:UV DNA damage repair endonuclease UvsE [Adhaeribacter rhizoryzae]KAA5548421.1 UV DNA damage repair endonuclease UvsE [Adhaeribacter rhizoryzae]
MKIGYPCINETLPCSSATTFRLASYSEERLIQAVTNNLACLQQILEFNVQHGLLFFRMSSDLVPFGSHPVNTFNWQDYFKPTFAAIGQYIKQNNLRISMHPDQFVVLNSPTEHIVQNSFAELAYQCAIMDLMELNKSAKLQIHAGGVYGDKPNAIMRFADAVQVLPDNIRARLVVENDDRSYSLQDCLEIHERTNIPILFDNFHHECLNNGEPMAEALRLAAQTWQPEDGILMIDYSSQSPGDRKGKHIAHIQLDLFREFLTHLQDLDVDIMLEIKDKEASAVQALALLRELGYVPATEPVL